MLSVLKQSPFHYPRARLPGFDPSHPAAAGMWPGKGISIVFQPGAFNVLTGAPCAKASTSYPAASIIPELGTCGLNTGAGGTQVLKVTGQNTGTPAGITFAGIVAWTGTGNGNITAIGGTTGTPNFNQFGREGGGGNQLVIYNNGRVDSTFTVANNVPHFVAASLKSASTVNIVATNLTTGRIYTTASTTATALIADPGTVSIGADGIAAGFGNYANGYIAAMMYAPAFISMRHLVAWAADPWSFWYPPAIESRLMFSVAPAGPILTQSHFRFRTDSGAVDATPTWGANEDTP